MTIEYIALIIRLIVLVGAVLFAFALLFFGFSIVVREYNKLKSWEQMKEFLTITTQAGLQADAAKGTIGLSRTTPGVLLIGIGAVILGFCSLQKFEYSLKQSYDADSTMHSSVDDQSFSFEEQTSHALQDLDKRITKLEQQVFKSDSVGKKELSDKHEQTPRTTFFRFASMESENTNLKTVNPASYISSFLPPKPKESILDKWLKSVPDITGKPVTDQFAILQKRYGNVPVKFDRVMIGSAKSITQIALEEYGHVRYAPLLLAFNPELPSDGSPVPIYSFIRVYYPVSQPPSPYRRELSIKISGMSRNQIYDQVLSAVNKIMDTEAYQANPSTWWTDHFPQLGAVEFARAMNLETGRSWGVRVINPEDGDSLELTARVLYGDRKYVNILKFLNYHQSALFTDTKAALPSQTQLVVMQLNEL